MPRVAQAMVYEVRSKRSAVHVKEIDPRTIDAALCVQAASRVMAELLRLYHVDGEADVTEAMAALMRGHIPLVEAFGDETVGHGQDHSPESDTGSNINLLQSNY